MAGSFEKAKYNLKRVFRLMGINSEHLATNIVLYPAVKGSTLIQIGYVPPLFSRPIGVGPYAQHTNLFTCVLSLYQQQGFLHLYSGCCTHLTAKFLEIGLTNYLASLLRQQVSMNKQGHGSTFMCDLTAAVTATWVTHPLFVLHTHLVAQSVGEEMAYRGVYTCLRSMLYDAGVLGLWRGCAPRLLCSVLTLTITGAIYCLVIRITDTTHHRRRSIPHIVTLLTSALLYPLKVVTSCSSLIGSRMIAANPPLMPRYSSWRDCLRHLWRERQLWRGGLAACLQTISI